MGRFKKRKEGGGEDKDDSDAGDEDGRCRSY